MINPSLYIHVPFCQRKCPYCHFYVLPDNEAAQVLFLKGLELEWQQVADHLTQAPLQSLYFGGGTPSMLGSARIGRIIEMIKKDVSLTSDCEITLEANPEHIDYQEMADYALAGINRVSLGVQSLDPVLLKTLGREHSAEQAKLAVAKIHQAGITNISIDLMYDVPGQTRASWLNSLTEAAALPISHLSLYNLTIEPNTVFAKRKEQIIPLLPDDATSTWMYQTAIEVLEAAGLMRYEISAFARDGALSRHNIGYWTGRPFWGLGPSAFSYWEGRRFRNIAHLKRYVERLENKQSPIDFEEQLDAAAQTRERLAIGLRLRKGVDLCDFQLPMETQQVLDQLARDGLIEKAGSLVRLTERGTFLYDTVATELI